MIITKRHLWIIVSKDHKLVVRGNGNVRELVPIGSNEEMRLITFDTKSRATSALSRTSFSGMDLIKEYRESDDATHYRWTHDPNNFEQSISNPDYIPNSEYLEAVEVLMEVTTIDTQNYTFCDICDHWNKDPFTCSMCFDGGMFKGRLPTS